LLNALSIFTQNLLLISATGFHAVCKTAIQGKVKEFGGGVDEGKTEGDEGVNAAGYYGIEKKLVKHLSNLLH